MGKLFQVQGTATLLYPNGGALTSQIPTFYVGPAQAVSTEFGARMVAMDILAAGVRDTSEVMFNLTIIEVTDG